jgi:predicted lipase
MSIEEVTRASIAAQYSELIYEMDKADNIGNTGNDSSSASGIFLESGVDAVYMTQYEDKYCMVVFRGTEPLSIEDWITNIDLDAVNLFNDSTTCQVHKGYYNAYYEFEYRDQIEEFLQSCQIECLECDTLLTGHSQGGAIAGVAGILLQSKYKPFVITFGGTFSICFFRCIGNLLKNI